MKLIQTILLLILFASVKAQNIVIPQVKGLDSSINSKQPLLISGTNIKTVNGSTILGSGNLSVSGSSSVDTTPIWKRYGTVLTATTAQDADGVGEPFVMKDVNSQIVSGNSADTVFKMWYGGGWSTPYINYAESLDGLTWTKFSGNPLISGHARQSVVKNSSTYVMYTALNSTGDQIDRYTSTNGTTWTLANSAVISKGSAGTWNANGVHNSHVFIEGGTWKMLIEGMRTSFGNSIGYYTSSDGITWTPYASNPVLSANSIISGGGGVGGPHLQKVGSTYYLYAHSTGTATTSLLPSDLYKFYSTDLINWTRVGMIFQRGTTDEGVGTTVGQAADCSIVQVGNDKTYFYYSGTSNGSAQSGMARIKLAIANLPIAQVVTTMEGENSRVNPGGLTGYVQFNLDNLHGGSPRFKWDNSASKIYLGNNTNTSLSQIYSRVDATTDGLVFTAGGGTRNWYMNSNGDFQSLSATITNTMIAGAFSSSGSLPLVLNRPNATSAIRAQWQTGGVTDYYWGTRGINNKVFYFDGVLNDTKYVFTGSGNSSTSGSSAVNGAVGNPNYTSSLVSIESTAMGLMLPRMTTTQRNAINVTPGTLTNFNITSTGSGYTSAPTISFSGGTGSGATATVTVQTGAVQANSFTFSGGSGYTPGDVVTVTFSGGGATTQATATVRVGQVGTMIYNTTTDTIDFYNGTTWKSLAIAP